MWERRKSEPTAPTAQPAAEPVRSGPTAAPAPAPRSEPASQGTAIGKAVSIIGDIESAEDLFVDGEVKGNLNVRSSRLTIGPNGKAQSDVKAREVIIHGKVQGNVEATQKITIRREGSLVGNIKTTGIVIEDDAYFKGSIDIVRNKEPEVRAKEPEVRAKEPERAAS
jgi:cytoskeletal protein CcmA (bactofilin family)